MIDFTKYNHCISTMPLFQGLSLNEIQCVQNDITEQAFSTGQFIYQAEEILQSLYLIQEGRVKVYRIGSSGKEQIIRILEQGDFVGELALFEEQHYEFFIEAILPTKVCTIHKEDFKRILLLHPQIALELLSEMARRLNSTERLTAEITTESVETRLIKYLLGENIKQKTIQIKLETTKKELASYLRMTPETLSRYLTKLTKNRLIRQPHPNIIELINIDQLKDSMINLK
ncbi:Crp/Fnr family transcriptional regulator [Enterococcus faecalis]|uniref:Crp/Fnr family transcriptional regulator n=1 Tax=Enterococcus faecalis TaxID=1351 RepID=UPI0021DFFC36|nr:Crp/Fnr family transcriptional regulator [Enterococcus faecalis]MCU9789231.1 Crp/Fnr family transcriptional regulator [Enterococcus faecalis]